MSSVTLRKTANELRRMKALGLKYWWTPGSSKPYCASHAQWGDDRLVAGPEDFYTYDESLDGVHGNRVFRLKVEYPF